MDREKIKLGLLAAAGGAVVLAVVGFTWGGWLTEGTAQEITAVAAEKAVVDRLAAICVDQYNQDPEKDPKLKKMKEDSSWNRFRYVEKQGWSTMPGDSDPDSAVSRECADLLSQLGG